MRTSRWKLIIYPGNGQTYTELYDLYKDAGEQINVAERFPQVRNSLLETLKRWRMNAPPASPGPDQDPEILEKLRSLGYVGGF